MLRAFAFQRHTSYEILARNTSINIEILIKQRNVTLAYTIPALKLFRHCSYPKEKCHL